MVSTSSFLTGLKTEGVVDAETTPKVLLGAASPLWLMFGGAAMAGATWWWWSNRWRESVNLEALMALRPEPVAPPTPTTLAEAIAPTLAIAPAATLLDAAEAAEPVILAAVAAVEATVEAVAEVATAVIEAAPTPVEIIALTPAPAAQIVAETVEATVAAAEPVVETVEATQAAVVEAATATADDLTRLVGIGPKLAAALADRGVTSFAAIAAWGEAELAEVDKALDLKGRAGRDAWVAQAKRLAEGAAA